MRSDGVKEVWTKAYFLIRIDLDLSPGKIAVQVGHGCDLIWQNRQADEVAFADWISRSDRRKILLKVDTGEKLRNIQERLSSANQLCYPIVDCGFTELDGPTETGLVIFPTNDPDKAIKRLRLYA